MVSVGVMMLDLGLQGMRNNVWVGMLSFAALGLVVFAQDDGTDATTNKAVTIQAAPASSGADAVSDGDTAGTAETAVESIADAIIDGVDGTPPEAPDLTSEETSSSAIADDNYTPTERISEDRSVSFPVDI